jgi:hypothetical protein
LARIVDVGGPSSDLRPHPPAIPIACSVARGLRNMADPGCRPCSAHGFRRVRRSAARRRRRPSANRAHTELCAGFARPDPRRQTMRRPFVVPTWPGTRRPGIGSRSLGQATARGSCCCTCGGGLIRQGVADDGSADGRHRVADDRGCDERHSSRTGENSPGLSGGHVGRLAHSERGRQ